MYEEISYTQQTTEECLTGPHYEADVPEKLMKKRLTMPHTFVIVDRKKWEEVQKQAEEFWASEEGQKRRQEIRVCAARFREIITAGKTTVKLVRNEESEEDKDGNL